ncbi:MAG: 16S rRNA (cytosine(1402)-N(4))-methyltransferase RsmH [Patescibacteria group bacterium]|jgi:16S rRNA (cytosine1402-N4)-methyltransferase
MEYHHTPVMLSEALEYLNIKKGGYYIDCTLGGGGYTGAIADKVGEKGKVLAIDADELAIENAKLKIEKLKIKNSFLSHANFRNLPIIIKKNFPEPGVKFDGIVFDLGLSSAQLARETGGFSFKMAEAGLDMAFGKTLETAENIVNSRPKDELARIFKEYGEERFAWRIVEKITEKRKKEKIKTVGALVEIINAAVPAFYRRGKIHPATKTFQALRIATNDELGALSEALPEAISLLKEGGRLVVISYHSLEDRIVKRFFKENAGKVSKRSKYGEKEDNEKADLKILTKKVIVPSNEEIKNNPRARSAKLRAAEKLKIKN